MTRLETHWINEDLELKIGEIRSHAARLSSADLEALEKTLEDLATATTHLAEMVKGIPHNRC